jgi:hypothetical protein
MKGNKNKSEYVWVYFYEFIKILKKGGNVNGKVYSRYSCRSNLESGRC